MKSYIKDPCGIFCIILTYLCVIYADYVVINHIILKSLSGSLWGIIHILLFNLIIFLLCFSHLRAVLTDPGLVPLPEVALDFSEARTLLNKNSQTQSEDVWTICQRCDSYRPPRAHHCSVCDRCIRKMDHHCPWINNCVGELNQKYFIQFLFYTGILCFYSLGLTIVNWILIFSPNKTNSDLLAKKSAIAHGVGLCVESITFGIFVIVMLYDQISSIFDDETTVESTIHRSRNVKTPKSRKPRKALMREVFGYGPMYFWFLPCLSPPNGIARSHVLGSYDV